MAAPSESEWTTRKKRIDPQLVTSGWMVEPFGLSSSPKSYTHHALTEFPTANGPADYALVAAGQIFGVIEAKKITLGPQNVLNSGRALCPRRHRLSFRLRWFPCALPLFHQRRVSVGSRYSSAAKAAPTSMQPPYWNASGQSGVRVRRITSLTG
jgi:hypothetical protein